MRRHQCDFSCLPSVDSLNTLLIRLKHYGGRDGEPDGERRDVHFGWLIDCVRTDCTAHGVVKNMILAVFAHQRSDEEVVIDRVIEATSAGR